MHGHRRERSSLSTNCSQSSGHSRVLPFATAHALQPASRLRMEAITEAPESPAKHYISGNRRFALAQPRRVITQPCAVAAATRAAAKRHSAAIGIGALLGGDKGPKQVSVRPIIGLGLTLNPRDNLVRLQPRRSGAQMPAAVHSPECNATARSSLVLSEAFAASPLLESCVSLADLCVSPRDPQMVPLPRASVCTQQRQQMAADSWLSSPADSEPPDTDVVSTRSASSDACVPKSSSSALSAPSESAISIATSRPEDPMDLDHARVPETISCLLCFEQVKISINHTQYTSCPGCGTTLHLPRPLGCSLYRLPAPTEHQLLTNQF
ncbi:hypothetical protein IWW55_005745 [Coemansia sp. RSA 2706]|nr:hypothetical protein LPJ70_002273 [Coemansia sp. RSA 2708]KAJ2293383.1 hypothetical protein IWW55_005745 [Coemansia sp. RSA 2706]KAJ2317001.1 hypothetical protein IWW52_003358 [Coemansia sp. RSA 2704]KAJ2327164.1 hypothetical protein IWW51_001899 [Coemansia sp. RSA 2702]KAJ2730455.1 hypothetical protein H4R23_003316 [Coemansia sp. Cherry 401B]